MGSLMPVFRLSVLHVTVYQHLALLTESQFNYVYYMT